MKPLSLKPLCFRLYGLKNKPFGLKTPFKSSKIHKSLLSETSLLRAIRPFLKGLPRKACAKFELFYAGPQPVLRALLGGRRAYFAPSPASLQKNSLFQKLLIGLALLPLQITANSLDSNRGAKANSLLLPHITADSLSDKKSLLKSSQNLSFKDNAPHIYPQKHQLLGLKASASASASKQHPKKNPLIEYLALRASASAPAFVGQPNSIISTEKASSTQSAKRRVDPLSQSAEKASSTEKIKKHHDTRFQGAAEISPIVDQNEILLQADIAFLKAKAALWEGRTEEAFRNFKTALRFAPRSQTLFLSLAELYEQEGLSAEALRFYQILAENEPKSKIFQEKLAQIYKKKGLFQQALQHNQALLEQKPLRFAPLLSQAELLLRAQDLKRFLKTFKVLENQARQPYEKIQLFILKAYAGSVFPSLPQGAKLDLIDIEEPFYTEDVILKIADFYESFGQRKEAQALLERFQITRKGVFSHKTAKALFHYYINLRDHKKAFNNAKHLLQLGQMEDTHYLYMASSFMDFKQYDKAILFLKDLNQRQPQKGNYLYLTGLAFEQKGQFQLALKWFQKIPDWSGYFLSGGLKRAQILKALGRAKESKALLKNLSFPSQGEVVVEALLPYAEELIRGGHKSQALSALNKGLKLKPKNQDLLFAKGLYLNRAKPPNKLAQE